MNFEPIKNQIDKGKRVHDFDQTLFISQVLIFFVEALNKKLWGKSFIFCSKSKTELFWRIAETAFQILRKTLEKQKF